MKKLGKKLIAGTAFAAAAVFTAGCGSGPPTVYGPPEYFEQESTAQESETTTESYDVTTEVPEALYGPPAFDPSGEVPEDVYGPPSYFE